MGSRTVREEFCHEGHRRDEDGFWASDSVYGTTLRATMSTIVKYPTGKSEAVRLGWRDQVFDEPSNHKVQ